MSVDLTISIVQVLRQHVGRDSIISAQEIATEIGLRQKHGDRLVRELITDALHDGTLELYEIPLCAIPGQGYFLASDIEEAQAYADFCQTLATEAARKTKAIRKLFKGIGLTLTSK
jgi:hypothetical protein